MSATQEALEIRALARDFAAAELRPHAETWDAGRSMDSDVIGKIAELGFFGMLVPESAGGMGFDHATYVAALEELAWGEPGAAVLVAESVIAADLLSRYGGDAHAGHVTDLAAGAQLGGVAFASDDGLVSATRSADGWTLSGRTSWVTNGSAAHVFVVAARAGEDAALFAVRRSAGIRSGAVAATMGLRAAPVTSLEFEGVNVPTDARLAWDGTDPQQAIDPVAPLSVAAIATGIAQAALDHAIGYAAQREQFGRALREFEGIGHKLAEMATRVAAARALVQHAAAQPESAGAVAMAKLAAGTAAMFVTTEAVQIFGGYGYMRDYPVEKLMRDAKAMEILHGSNETQRLKIAASLYAG